jgi:hypothetical protein
VTNASDNTFTGLTITAYSGRVAANTNGGAGTIYIKGTNNVYGTLIVDNGMINTFNVNRTFFSPIVTDYTPFGNVVLRNSGELNIGTNIVAVYNNWSNTTITAGITNGTVIFNGSNPQYIYGNNDWSNLTFSTAGTTIYFQPTKNQIIYGELTLPSLITLRSISDGTRWRLTKTGSGIESLPAVVYVKDSDASNGKTMAALMIGSHDLGGNINWIFFEGTTIPQYRNIFDSINTLDP